MNRLAKLGAPAGESIPLPAPPFRFFLGGWLVILLGIASIAGGAAMAILGHEPAGGVFFCGLGMFFVIGGFFMHRQREVSRGALELHAHGFIHAHGKRRRAVVLEEITALSLAESEELRNGVKAGLRRTLTLRDGEGKIVIRQLTLTGQQDTFGMLLARVIDQMGASWERRMTAGEPLRGAGWSLDGGGLAYSGASRPLAFTEIAAADLFEGKVALWRLDEEAPCFTVPAISANAQLLLALARKHLPAQRAGRTDPDSLGRLLFQKKAGRSALIILALFGLGLAGFGAWLLRDGTPDDFRLGIIALVLGPLILAFTLHLAFAHFRVHELGVERRNLLGRRRLRYTEIALFNYSATRMYHNGVYTGTAIAMSFAPAGGKALSLSSTQRGSDADLDLLRDRVAEMISMRLYDQIKAGSEVPWGKNCRLTREGVRYREKKLFGKGAEAFLAYASGVRESFANGFFNLYDREGKKPVHTIACGEENFYPGYLLFVRLVTEAVQPAPAAPRSQA
jgi:hypothetical protein